MSSSTTPDLTLYSASISNASARLRIALNLKKLQYNLITINLSKGEQHSATFKGLTPSGTVPLLVHQDEVSGKKVIIGQSIAALEYLNEAFPHTKRLLPKDPALRAQIRALVAILAGDTHPLLTHRVAKAMKETFPDADIEQQHDAWQKHWVSEGLRKFEGLLKAEGTSGRYCVGDEITLADVVLLPEVWYARRIGVDVTAFPRVQRTCEHLCLIEAVEKEEQTLEKK